MEHELTSDVIVIVSFNVYLVMDLSFIVFVVNINFNVVAFL